MKAVTWQGTRSVGVTDVPDPEIRDVGSRSRWRGMPRFHGSWLGFRVQDSASSGGFLQELMAVAAIGYTPCSVSEPAATRSPRPQQRPPT